MKSIWKAWYDSRNFEFEAYGETPEGAKATLIKGLRKHGKQYNCEPNWWYADDICVLRYDLDTPFRDRDTI
jgi:hypothetical protein